MRRCFIALAVVAGLLPLGCAIATDEGVGPWTSSTHELEVTSPDPANPTGEPGSGAQDGPGEQSSDPDKPTPDPWQGSGSGGGNGSENDEESGSSPSDAPAGDGTR